MRAYLLFAILLIAGTGSRAQTYQFTHFTSTYSDLAGATVLTDSGTVWDDEVYTIPIGFNFTYMGQSFTNMIVDTYGLLDFSNGNYELVFLGFLADLMDAGTTSSVSPVSYLLSGTPGNRILKIEFKNCGFFSGPQGSFVNFQIWLMEADNSLEVHMGPNSVPSPSVSYDGETGPVIGVVKTNTGATATVYALTLVGSPANPSTVMLDINNMQFLNGTPASGQVYRFSITGTSLPEWEAGSFAITAYPNPVEMSGEVKLTLDKERDVKVTVVNMMGQKVMDVYSGRLSAGTQTVSADLSALQAGSYIVCIEDVSDVKRATCIVQKK
jgi:hypothetical protein